MIAFRDELNIDALVRSVRYRGLERSDSGVAASFDHLSSSSDSYALLDQNVLVCSTHDLLLFSQSGTQYISESLSFSQPVIRSSGSYAIVFDAGGSEYYIISGRELKHHGITEDNRSLISATITAEGQYALVTTERGYKGTVELYRSIGTLSAAYRFSSEFVADCALSSNASVLIVSTLAQEGSSYRTTLHYYRQSESEAFASSAEYGNVVLDLSVQGSTLWVLGENALNCYDLSGALLGSYDYSAGYLKHYSLGGNGFATLFIGKYRAGSLGTLLMIDSTGAVIGSQSINEQILSLSAAGRYSAVLTYDSLEIYTDNFSVYAQVSDTDNAQKVLMRADGSAALISDKYVQQFIPG